MKKIKITTQDTIEIDFKSHFHNLIKINESLNFGAATHYKKSGLTYVDVPSIVGITGACENVDTLFRVGNRHGIPLFFTQTGQLALEQALQTIAGAYTVIHSGRDEEEEDERHLRQFRLTEEEFDCTFAGMTRETYDEEKMYETLLTHIEKAVKAMVHQVIEDNEQILRNTYGRNATKLRNMLTTPFYRINYEDAIELLKENGLKEVEFGDDLKSIHEAKIVELLNKNGEQIPVFICRYPKEIKFFNMKVSEKDPRIVLSADLILPYAGEATGSAVREHEHKKLNERLLTSTMYRLHKERGGTYEDFFWYLEIIRAQGTNPHAGYGIGNERVMQYILGTTDINNVSMFALLNRQTGDWNKAKARKEPILEIPEQPIVIAG